MSDLWSIVGAEANADQMGRLVEAALIETEPYRNIVIQATSAEDFENRLSTVADRLDSAIADVVESDERFPQVRAQVVSRYRAEFRNNERAVKKAAKAAADRKALLRQEVVADLKKQAADDWDEVFNWAKNTIGSEVLTMLKGHLADHLVEADPYFYTEVGTSDMNNLIYSDLQYCYQQGFNVSQVMDYFFDQFDITASRKTAGWVEAPVVQAFDVLDAENNYIATVCKDCANRDYFGLITEPTSHDDLEGDPSVGIWPITECSGCGASFLPDIMWEASRKTAANAIYAVDCLDCGWSTSDSDTINTADYKGECPDCGSDDLEFLALSDNGVTLIPTERRLATRKTASSIQECQWCLGPGDTNCNWCEGTGYLESVQQADGSFGWEPALRPVESVRKIAMFACMECGKKYKNPPRNGQCSKCHGYDIDLDVTASRKTAEQYDPDTFMDACQDCINDMMLDGIVRSKPAVHDMRCEICGAKVMPGEVMYDVLENDVYNDIEVAAKKSPWGTLVNTTDLAKGIMSGYTASRQGGICLTGTARRHMERVRPLYAAQGIRMGKQLWFDDRTGWALVATLWPNAVSPTKSMPPKRIAKSMPSKVAKRYLADIQAGGVKVNANKKTASTGFSCKNCGAESPVGVGYKDDGPYPSADPNCMNYHVVDGEVVAGDGGEVPSHMTASKKQAGAPREEHDWTEIGGGFYECEHCSGRYQPGPHDDPYDPSTWGVGYCPVASANAYNASRKTASGGMYVQVKDETAEGYGYWANLYDSDGMPLADVESIPTMAQVDSEALAYFGVERTEDWHAARGRGSDWVEAAVKDTFEYTDKPYYATKKKAYSDEYDEYGLDVYIGDTCPECGSGTIVEDADYGDCYCAHCGAEFGDL